MRIKTFIAGKDDDGRRIDRVLRRILADSAKMHQLLRKSLIKLNGKKIDAAEKVHEGDEISVAAFLLQNTDSEREKKQDSRTVSQSLIEEIQKNTLLQTDDFLIINKPYDVSVQGGKTNVNNAVSALFNAAHQNDSLSFRPGPLHRLDRKTTGVLVFSQSISGAKWFSEQIAAHRIKKTYLAIIEGNLKKNARWEDFIFEGDENKSDSRIFHTVTTKSAQGKNAITNAIPLAFGTYNGAPVTLAEFKIETGRKHQIRAQSALHGFPLLGDTAYGGQKIKESQDFFLHAYRLEFPQKNPFGLPSCVDAFILTNFRKMLTKILINCDDIRII